MSKAKIRNVEYVPNQDKGGGSAHNHDGLFGNEKPSAQ